MRAGTENIVKLSHLNFVDLAGQEKRYGRGTARDGVESRHINRSLMILANVIHKLSEGAAHIPFRDSKLTRILSNSLGGNAKTQLICCCHPGFTYLSETRNTLRFATRAAKVRNKAEVNIVGKEETCLEMYWREI